VSGGKSAMGLLLWDRTQWSQSGDAAPARGVGQVTIVAK
jgi:hypothetical protein